jgi:hypothetical protein
MRNHVIAAASMLASLALGAAPAATTPGGSAPATPSGGTVKSVRIATEDAAFTLDATTAVSFGAGDAWVSKVLGPGKYTCDRMLFGDDPAPFTAKFCHGATAR